jgi:putative monooxygenase
MPPTDTATASFREFSNPATGEQIQVTATARDGAEDVARFNWRSMPGGAITEHLHPHQEERFIIAAGEAHFTVNGEERVAGPGETIVVPIGVRHSESNPGAVQIEGVVELRPALHTKEMFEAFGGLGSEGKTTSRGAPKNPLQLGATLWRAPLLRAMGQPDPTGPRSPASVRRAKGSRSSTNEIALGGSILPINTAWSSDR